MTSERLAWFHCFAGIAGDMALGALLDAGADEGDVQGVLSALPISGWRLIATKELRGGLSGTRALVSTDDTDHLTRNYRDIVALIEKAELPERVASRALSVFHELGVAEAKLHGETLEKIHFHEVGGHDAIIDIVGVCAALEALHIDEIASSPVAHGLGAVRSRHGLLPNPPPAVLELLRDVPVYGRDIALELTTPTGAALLSALASSFGPLPAMTIASIGYGAGSRELEGLPNLTQVVIGTRTTAELTPSGQPLVVLEATLDDATGEQLADALDELIKAGAADAWITPVLMKKGRPGQVLSVLADPAKEKALREILLVTTGTFGVRAHVVDRFSDSRAMSSVEIEGTSIAIKASARRVKAEHDDALVLARALGVSVREIQARAEEAYRQAQQQSE